MAYDLCLADEQASGACGPVRHPLHLYESPELCPGWESIAFSDIASDSMVIILFVRNLIGIGFTFAI
jgi:hypothetical protein